MSQGKICNVWHPIKKYQAYVCILKCQPCARHIPDIINLFDKF